MAANLFNAVWIFLWHYLKFPLTLIAMAGLLVSLLAIYLKLRIGLEKRKLADRLLVETPFSIYLGWITVATVANVSQVLYAVAGWRGGPFSEPVWAVAMLAVAVLLGVLMIFLRKEVAYPLVLVWAFVGIWASRPRRPWWRGRQWPARCCWVCWRWAGGFGGRWQRRGKAAPVRLR